MNPQVLTKKKSEKLQPCPQLEVSEEQTDEHTSVQKDQPLIGTKVENDPVSSAASVVLEGIDTSLIFPQRTGSGGSVTFQWEGNKDVLQPGECKSVGTLLFPQANTLAEVLQELFRPSNAPLQIILESQNADKVPIERIVNHVAANSTSKEVNVNTSDTANYQHEFKGSDMVTGEIHCNKKQENIMDNLRKTDSFSTFQLIHKCCYCRFRSETVAIVLEHVRKKHPGKPVKTKAISGRDCPYCGLRLDQTAFFQHMRQFHENSHPCKCGYCNFMARDLNQLKHHCTKKHRGLPFKAFRRTISELHKTVQNKEKRIPQNTNATVVDRSVSKAVCEINEACSDEQSESMEMVEYLGNTLQNCPICHKKVKTLKYLKVHMRVHSKGRYKCGYCGYISAYCLQVLLHCKKRHWHLQPLVKQHELDPQQDKNIVKNYDVFMEEVKKKCSKQPPDPDTRKWARKYSCPTCEYTCSYGASYRRHLTTHSKNPLPFRCHYCPFEGREKYYIRRHIQRIHRGFPAIVVENNGEHSEKVPGDLKKNLPSLKIPLKNLESKRNKTFLRDSIEIKKCVQKPEECTLVNAPEVEVREKVHAEEQIKDGRNDSFMSTIDEYIDNSLSAAIIGDNMGVNNRPKSILGPTDCVNFNMSREDQDKDSASPKLIEGLNNHLMAAFSSQKNTKIGFQNSLDHQYGSECKEAQGTLSVQATAPSFSADLKVTAESVEKDTQETQKAVIISDSLVPEREGGGAINLVNLLNVVNTDNCENFAVVSLEKGKGKNNVAHLNSKDVIGTKARDRTLKATRKKGSKEKSSHKAWDFVAYRDGRYTYCVCGIRTVNKAFYKHIKKHIDSKRFGCGYCSYRSIERAKIRVHHTFVHPGLPLNVNESEECVTGALDKNILKQTQACSSKEDKSNQPSKLKKESSSCRLPPLFHCPICKKKLSYHTYTIRRHLFSHCDYRPYRCGRCDFRGCSPGEVKQHSVFHGADLCPIVEPSGQQPPEGLEQLVTDCFKELQTKLGKRTRRKSKTTSKPILPVGEHLENGGFSLNGYHLVTIEASLWSQSLSDGVCPWCQVRIPSSLCSTGEPFTKEAKCGTIRSHFKDHFYKPVGDSPFNECRTDGGGSSLSTYPTGSLEEKDAVIMNGLMYYFINHPFMKESNGQKTSHGAHAGAFKGEIGIINNPDGMPPGTIQVTDFLLADLRHLLWGHVNESKSKKAQWHTCQQCKQQFRSSLALQKHSKMHTNSESFGKAEDKDHDFQKQPTTHAMSQVPDSEVGVFLLGDDMEVATAVVVINSEAEEREMVLEVSS